MKDLVKIKSRNIDMNKLTKPVVALAMKKAEEYKKELVNKASRQKQRVQSEKELQELEKKWTKIFENVYDLSCVDDKAAEYYYQKVPSNYNKLLEYLAKRYLYMRPEIGIKIIIEAYLEYYDIGRKCDYCRKTIPPSSRKGRTKNYCCDACRQKAYRQRNKHKKQCQ